MVTIEKLFDDGEDVLSRNPDVTFLHTLLVLLFPFFFPTCKYRAKVNLFRKTDLADMLRTKKRWQTEDASAFPKLTDERIALSI
jgi:hypothetical protein